MPSVHIPRTYVDTIQGAYVKNHYSGYLACPYCMCVHFWITDPEWPVKLGATITDDMPLALPDGSSVPPGDVPACQWCSNQMSTNLSMHVVSLQPPDFERERRRTESAW